MTSSISEKIWSWWFLLKFRSLLSLSRSSLTRGADSEGHRRNKVEFPFLVRKDVFSSKPISTKRESAVRIVSLIQEWSIGRQPWEYRYFILRCSSFTRVFCLSTRFFPHSCSTEARVIRYVSIRGTMSLLKKSMRVIELGVFARLIVFLSSVS